MRPSDIAALLDDRPGDGVFRVHADAFRRRDLFDLEMKHIFEEGWSFLGLACQIPNPHDFFTTRIGRQPVIVSRDAEGRIGCFVNSCRHRGALVCQHIAGNAKTHVCPYHGWAYDSGGRNVGIPAREQGGYTEAFGREDHGLRKAARFGEYRGFLFASLDADVGPLEAHLGDARVFIDLAVDQSEEGLEMVPGTVAYTYDGNWKMQLENSADAYHFFPTHQSYLQILGKRRPPASGGAAASVYQNFNERDLVRGSFCFAQGHSVLWGTNPAPEARPLYAGVEDLRRRVGETRARWMFYTRNVLIFPNLQLLENAALQIRVIRPLSVDKTEITTYCIAPKGESRAARTRRIRQYEEFFNPSGLATPDDTTVFAACQAGQPSDAVRWHQGYMRGLALAGEGPDEHARELGIAPTHSMAGAFGTGDETIFHGPYRAWRRRLEAALSSQPAPGAAR